MTKNLPCFQCKKSLTIKFIPNKHDYSKKNDWFFWTQKAENKEKYICNSCLLNLYKKNKERYLSEVSSQKQPLFRNYVYLKFFS